MKTKKNAQGAVLMVSAAKIWKFVKSNLLREYDLDLLGFIYDFSQQASSFVQSTAVCFATFCGDLLLQLLNPYHIISAVTALEAAAQLEGACPFCVLRDEHLSIDRPVNVSPALLTAGAGGFVCYTAAIPLAATS